MKSKFFFILISFFTIIFSFLGGGTGAFLVYRYNITGRNPLDIAKNLTQQNIQVIDESSKVIDVAQNSSQSVVSIVISKDVPIYQNYNPFSTPNDTFNPVMPQQKQTGTQQQQIGAGSGFVISDDGMIITNRHVVDDATASYTVIFNDGKKYDAKILAKDTLLDIAFIKVDAKGLKPLAFGTSNNLKVGQSVIAIGNALGEFSNTVSHGIISGLKRTITASDSGGNQSEQLSNVLQTDASINLGNSGGPLLDINGNVIGVNVAIAKDAQNIGFAIPIDVVKDLLGRFSKDGKIERPRLGVRYQLITPSIKTKYNLNVDSGALVIKGNNSEPAVLPNSPAQKAGIMENDIIISVDGKKIDQTNQLQTFVQNYKVGDTITLTILRKENQIDVKVKLDLFK